MKKNYFFAQKIKIPSQFKNFRAPSEVQKFISSIIGFMGIDQLHLTQITQNWKRNWKISIQSKEKCKKLVKIGKNSKMWFLGVFFAFFSGLSGYFSIPLSVLSYLGQMELIDTHKPNIWRKKILDLRRGHDIFKLAGNFNFWAKKIFFLHQMS